VKRRQLIKGILATGALSIVNKVDAMNLLVNDNFWSNIRNSFPKESEYINLLNTGGGAVPTTTLELLSKYQEITAGGGEYKTQALNSLKESGSSPSLRELMANTFGCLPNEIALTRNAMEVQNRAFALKSAQRMASKASSDEDRYFTDAWVAFEEFLQVKYSPFAAKYNLSQKAGIKANIQVGLGGLALDILPDAIALKTMLNQTVNYNEKLKELRKIAPKEEKEFFEFVVDQEEVQIAGIQLCIEGKMKEAADLVTDFIKKHS